MKSLKGYFIKTTILMLVISIVLVFVVTLLFVGVFSFKEPDGLTNILTTAKDVFKGYSNRMEAGRFSILSYLVIWATLLLILVLSTCTFLSILLSAKIRRPIEDLRKAVENIAEGNLEFEIMSCEEKELNELCVMLDDVRKKLRANAENEIKVREERNMLVANISHDMRTPITTIKGYLEGIRDGVADTPEKKQKYLDIIYSKALVLENLVDSMSVYSELELGRMQYQFEYVDLLPYFAALAEEYTPEVEAKNMKMVFEPCEEPLTVVADRNKLKRVIDNIVNNAMKYSKDGSVITINLSSDGRGALIRVSDTGKGITPGDVENVFSGFFRGDAARTEIKGNGLGLAIAREIVESHRGKIWVKSEENVGTDMYIYLPLRERNQDGRTENTGS